MRLTIRAAGGAFAVLALGLGARAAAGDYPTTPAYPTYHDAPAGCASGSCASGSCGTPVRAGGALNAKVNDRITQLRYGLPCQPCCKPKLSPGGCFGYHPTQWTPWEAVCPTASTVVIPVHTAPPVPAAAPAPTPSAPAPLPTTPAPTTAPKSPVKEPTPAPVTEPAPKPKDSPAAPPKGSAPEAPGKLDERGLILPPVPEIPVVAPSRF